LHDHLNMTKVCTKMVPKNLSQEQKDGRRQIYTDILGRIKKKPDLLTNVIICDETWIFQYDPENKRQFMHRKTSASPKIKKLEWASRNLKITDYVFVFERSGHEPYAFFQYDAYAYFNGRFYVIRIILRALIFWFPFEN